MADWPSGAPGVFPVGRCTMWAGPLRNIYKKWIVVNVRILSTAQTNDPLASVRPWFGALLKGTLVMAESTVHSRPPPTIPVLQSHKRIIHEYLCLYCKIKSK